jgi:glycosyltransferase involved in cell wall biosynthesis
LAIPPFDPGRTAIVHDWFQGFHGAERVVEAMVSDTFAIGDQPPDIYTFHAAHELLPAHLSARIVRESRLARQPFFRQRGHDPGHWRWLLPYMPHYFGHLPLQEYDLVVSSSHSSAIQARPRDDAFHLCYCYTPMRYAWMPEVEMGRVTGVKRMALRALRKRLRNLDLGAARRVDGFIAISSAVRERIQDFYGRDSVVIHPPVDVTDFDGTIEKEPGHFLWAHRFVGYKRPELVMEAFRDLPFRLTMVGVGPLREQLMHRRPDNVQIRGWVSREELAAHFARASGFIHIGEEDFGITMVEALAAGTPVIALDRGGARDIIRDEVDGLLLEEPDLETLRDAVRRLSGQSWNSLELRSRASSFSRERFTKELREYVTERVG